VTLIAEGYLLYSGVNIISDALIGFFSTYDLLIGGVTI
jgi:hypothetical protein